MQTAVDRHAGGSVATGTRDSRRDLLELAIGYGLILLVIWTPRPWQRWLTYATALFLAAVTWRAFHSWRAMGLRGTNLLRSMWVVVAAVFLAAIVVGVSHRAGTMHPVGGPRDFVRRYWGYAIWALVQQLLLQDFFLRRLLNVWPRRQVLAALAAAGIFALAHLPNPVLTPITFCWGYLACLLFLRYRNIFPLAMAHALVGITLSTAIPNSVMHNMRVGLGYLHYVPHRPSQRNQIDHTVSTQAWVSAEAPTRRS